MLKVSDNRIPGLAEHDVLAGDVGVLGHHLLAEGIQPLDLGLQAGVVIKLDPFAVVSFKLWGLKLSFNLM